MTNVVVTLDEGLRSIGRNDAGQETIFDTSIKGGGLGSAASPVQIMLEAAAACSIMDVAAMLRKRQKNVIGLTVEVSGERRDEDPKIFTSMHMIFRLTSPDATKEELDYCIQLSHDKYCTVSNTIKLAGAVITSESHIVSEPSLSDLERADQSL